MIEFRASAWSSQTGDGGMEVGRGEQAEKNTEKKEYREKSEVTEIPKSPILASSHVGKVLHSQHSERVKHC